MRWLAATLRARLTRPTSVWGSGTEISKNDRAVARRYSEGPPYQADLRVGERNRNF
jgi:hypothetical protein